jgi:hypothetical protein
MQRPWAELRKALLQRLAFAFWRPHVLLQCITAEFTGKLQHRQAGLYQTPTPGHVKYCMYRQQRVLSPI